MLLYMLFLFIYLFLTLFCYVAKLKNFIKDESKIKFPSVLVSWYDIWCLISFVKEDATNLKKKYLAVNMTCSHFYVFESG